MRGRVPAPWWVLALALLLAPGVEGAGSPVRAQEETRPDRASRYLALDSPLYRYVDLLIDRGVLRGLNPQVRPYRRLDVARAVRRARSSRAAGLREPERRWLDILAGKLAGEMAFLRREEGGEAGEGGKADGEGGAVRTVSGALRAGSWGVAHTHRDPLRPTGDPAVLPFFEAEGAMEFSPVVAVLRFRWDEWFVNDPQFPEGRVVESHPNFLGAMDFAGRAEEAYLELQVPHFRLMAGRLYRNWGPGGTRGLLVSDYPYSYDQVGYWVGVDELSLTGFVAQLDEYEGNVKRWLSAHRLDWRPSDDLLLAVTEQVVYGGENRSFDFRLSNPVNVWLVGGFGEDFREGPNTSNNLTELAAWWRPGRELVTYLSVMIDELPGGGTPLEHAVALGLRLPRIGPRLSLRLDYSQVAALTYRTRRDFERVAFRENGLGRDFSDYDLLSVKAEWLPAPGLMVVPALQLLRRGEGDFRDPLPADRSKSGPVLFIGETETTLRVSGGGHWLLGDTGWLEWDIGLNFVWDRHHVTGRRSTELTGRARFTVETGGWSPFGS